MILAQQNILVYVYENDAKKCIIIANTMFKRIKKEAFFIIKLFSQEQRYELSSYFHYFKYRFFSRFILAKLPKYQCQVRPDFALHMICQEEDVVMAEWAIRSFLKYSELCPKIIIHDDGTITKDSARMLESKFSNLKVLFKSEALKMLEDHKDFQGKIREFRVNGHNVLIQLIDILLLSDTAKVMIMDSDILFFHKPQEIINFVNGQVDCDALISRQPGSYDLMINNDYADKYHIYERQAGFMNSGMAVFKKASISRDKFYEFFDNTKKSHGDYFLGMSGWGCLISQLNYKFLPEDKYILKGRPTKDTIMKHFTGPRRYELFAYGIDKFRNNSS